MDQEDIPLYPFFGAGRTLVFAHDYAAGSLQPLHRHDVPQLLHAARGVMRVTTPGGYWVIPPNRGVWIPAFMPHEIRMVGPVSMRTLYVEAGSAPAGVEACAVVAIAPLLQRLLEELAVADPRLPRPTDARYRTMEELALIEIARLEQLPLNVRMPRDPRLLKLCTALLERPHDASTLDDLAYEIGASTRTLRRLFQDELGMSFADWRQQVRLMEAFARLAEGQAVTRVSRDLGYAAPSAFIAMFKRAMGCPPSQYAKTDPSLSHGWSRQAGPVRRQLPA
ncbi:HTH-type transcriptional repressor of iron proteins A [Pigmentiphaga humi]|uniref:HTH-type transcriptional repressor of iron proteins A n=1 Tax=Pigmentiphaga humi TaxID=2478468 RepID=A0A3P4AX72_9BURK|nr:helix-turn-helix transcriptional regulator [Pigmentiphaga humi]VCU67986.1 HTH-type transcriptional repressor of iron proteins A [Pigmentiphaga humi]